MLPCCLWPVLTCLDTASRSIHDNLGVSSVEEETGESNAGSLNRYPHKVTLTERVTIEIQCRAKAVMLRALRKKYPKGSRLLWVCGDDVPLGSRGTRRSRVQTTANCTGFALNPTPLHPTASHCILLLTTNFHRKLAPSHKRYLIIIMKGYERYCPRWIVSCDE